MVTLKRFKSDINWLVWVAIIVIIVRVFLVQPFIVDGSSMEPNFHDKEYILVDKLSYRFRAPARGEVIVFHPPNFPTENYIKRIIGLPGDTVDIANGKIDVNGVEISEPYLNSLPSDTTTVINLPPKVKVPAGQYFVLGDNRNHSSDSREWGLLPKANIIGRTWLVVLPIHDFGFVFDPAYAGVGN